MSTKKVNLTEAEAIEILGRQYVVTTEEARAVWGEQAREKNWQKLDNNINFSASRLIQAKKMSEELYGEKFYLVPYPGLMAYRMFRSQYGPLIRYRGIRKNDDATKGDPRYRFSYGNAPPVRWYLIRKRPVQSRSRKYSLFLAFDFEERRKDPLPYGSYIKWDTRKEDFSVSYRSLGINELLNFLILHKAIFEARGEELYMPNEHLFATFTRWMPQTLYFHQHDENMVVVRYTTKEEWCWEITHIPCV